MISDSKLSAAEKSALEEDSSTVRYAHGLQANAIKISEQINLSLKYPNNEMPKSHFFGHGFFSSFCQSRFRYLRAPPYVSQVDALLLDPLLDKESVSVLKVDEVNLLGLSLEEQSYLSKDDTPPSVKRELVCSATQIFISLLFGR